MVVEAILIGTTILSLLYGLRCKLELRRWSNTIRHGRIAIARKGRVRLQAPLEEFALWTRQLDGDKESFGRVIYRDGNTSVAISKAVTPRQRRRSERGKAEAKQGTWTAKDETR